MTRDDFKEKIKSYIDEQYKLFEEKQKQYSTDDALADFRTYALAKYKNDDWFELYEVGKDFMGKHIAHIINHDITGDKIIESLDDISLYCHILRYFVEENNLNNMKKNKI